MMDSEQFSLFIDSQILSPQLACSGSMRNPPFPIPMKRRRRL